MRVLIVGGLGYIGSALCELHSTWDRHHVTVLDKRFVPERVAEFPAHFKFVQADMGDLERVRPYLKGLDVLYLLAAQVGAEGSANCERVVWEENFDKPRRLIEACDPETRVVFPSTANVFGGGGGTGLTEEDEPQPKYPYAETKREMEKYLLESGRNCVIARLGTNYGYASGVRFNLVTNNFVLKALRGEDLIVHGDGSNVRPTVCVEDSANALAWLAGFSHARNKAFLKKWQIYHVVRESLSIRELARRVIEAVGSSSQLRFIAKDVPFASYALSSARIERTGFRFHWDLETVMVHMAKAFHALRGNDAG